MPISIVDLFLVEHDLVWVKASEVKVVVVMARKPMMDNCMVDLTFDVYLMLRLPPNITKMYLLKRMQRRCLSALTLTNAISPAYVEGRWEEVEG